MIKVYEPIFNGNEKKYLIQAVDEGSISSGGRFVREFEEAFAKWSGNDYAVAVSSGTAALEVALVAGGCPKKQISIPNGTIISCYTAAVRAGYTIWVHDNGSDSIIQNVMHCHLFGKLDDTYGISITDDLSQYWKPHRVEIVGAYSLYANKLITSGEGGVVVTNDINIYEKAKDYRNLCHTYERFVHYREAFNYRMSNLQAAVALAQLEQINDFVEIKQKNRDLYLKHLGQNIKPHFNVDVPWMYLIETVEDAGFMVSELYKLGIECRRFFYPINKQPFINKPGNYPKSERLWQKSFYLPSGLTLTEKDIIHVSEAVRKTLRSAKSK